MGKLYRWNKFGDVEVFEGKCGIAVGKDVFDAFASKKGLEINKDGTVDYISESGYIGTWDKKEASRVVREVDKAMASGGKVTYFTVTHTGKPHKAFSQVDTKKGGILIVTEEGDVPGLIHEEAHLRKGHLGKDVRVTSWRDEKVAVRESIKELKKRGLYYPQVRFTIIEDLASYHKGKDLVSAEEFVYKNE